MAKNRYVNTHFWDDSYIVELTPSEKLVFLYLLTNPLTNMAGVYEITQRRIIFDTGLTSTIVEKALERFERDGKAIFLSSCNYVIIPNFLKNQKLNTNMRTGIDNLIPTLPKEVKSLLENSLGKALEGFDSLYNALNYFNLNLNSNLNLNVLPLSSGDEPEATVDDPVVSVISFEDFYQLYPRHEKKDEARKAWKKIGDKDRPIIMDVLRRQIATQHINTADKQFCPLPASWLNGKRWEDEITYRHGIQKQSAPSPFPKDVECKFCADGQDQYGMDKGHVYLLKEQGGSCPKCGERYYTKRDDGTWSERWPEANDRDMGGLFGKLADAKGIK